MTSERKLEGVQVGDELYYRNVNEHHGSRRTPSEVNAWTPPTVTVTKVGPKRVQYEMYGRTYYAAIDTGRVDDWSHLETQAQYHEGIARREMVAMLADHGLTVTGNGHRLSMDKLAAITLLLRGDD